MNRFLVFILMCLPVISFAQTSEKYNSEYENYYRAEELYAKEQFAAARIEFRNFLNGYKKPNDPMYIKALYYEGLSALELYNNDAVTLLMDFNKNYPESIYKNTIYFRLGKYYYQKKDFEEALVWFNQLKPTDVEHEEKEEYLFKLCYSNFQEKKYVEARSAFHEVKDGVSQYAAPGLYYYSHIAYMDKSYQTALDGFLKLQTNESFASVVPYYIAQIYYLQGKYAEVTKYAPSIVDSANVINETDMNHLIGDAYYRINKYDEAVPYLEKYNQKANTTRDDDYQLGFAYYKSNNYEKAIKLFDKVTRQQDSMGQVAFYHIGECYLKLNNLVSARSAFEAAADIDKDPVVQEDALYNYAILSYKLDLNPYDEAVIALETFLNRFPKSKRINEINQYLVNVYTSTNNYAKALASLDKLPNKDAKLKTAFQLVDKYPVDLTFSSKAKFWTADAFYRLNNMDKAIFEYKEYIALPSNLTQDLKADAYYNIGDAYMRVADGYYMTKQDKNAIKYYGEALKLKAGYEDQALFYQAKAYGFDDNEDAKIKNLLDIINNYPKSKYILLSIYEVAKEFKNKADYDKAYRYFNQILTDYPNSNLIVLSRLEIADIYYKKSEYAKAEKAYKDILVSNGNDKDICADAVNGLVAVYSALKQPEKVSDLASQYSCADISIDEQEGLYYTPAYEAYKDSSYATAIPQLVKYLDRFPNGKYITEAQFFLANSYYATKETEKGIAAYRKLLEGPNNSYTEFSAQRVAVYLYNNGLYEEAIPYYERLDKTSSKPAVIYTAKIGLMRCNFLIENWTNAAVNAKAVLGSSQINNTIRLEAEYANGMSQFYLNNFTEAKPSLEWIVKNTTTVQAAEAKYSLGEMYYKLEDYKKADTEIRALIKMKPSYTYWVAKGLILQSRMLIIQNDLFQAEQTLKSVIDHYPDEDDGILIEANELYDELMQLKNKPKAVEQPGETIIEVNEGGN